MLYVSWCILYVSYMYLKQRMEYIRIHTEYTTIHVSTPSHMARPVRLWDTPGYNGIQQDTSARAYPHRLHTWDTWGIHAAMMYPIVAGEIHAGYIQDTCCRRPAAPPPSPHGPGVEQHHERHADMWALGCEL